MADPRFYVNRGPLALGDVCAGLGIALPTGARVDANISDVAKLDSAGPEHLVFCAGAAALKELGSMQAGFCLIETIAEAVAPGGTLLLRCASPAAAFATIAGLLYPDHGLTRWEHADAIDRTAIAGERVSIAPGAVIGARAEIGDGTRIGPNAVIGPGVAIGRDCEIGSNVTITHSYVGDRVMILPGAQIGQPGFGFTSGRAGHEKIPQLGRVILQDRVEVGACTAIDRGALGDTVIGEGTKIDNLVQIGHNCRIGRHCVIVGQVGMGGSCELGDFVVLGGQAAVADHVKIGDGARLAGRTAAVPGELPGGQDYGGVPAIPIRDWRRQMAAIAMLGRRRKRE
ncbi:MAG TPA: UDP-3-O-(3-hydroxymyristoyl)glucosamine N-acyltransferase [Rhizomicrobium sp.]|nr:UDP-3-O-(3-hydroxymyristoyl)glucosamine N-acyltransferase [Rhizomicrobium sp.]